MASELYRRWQTLHLLYGSEKFQFKCINSPLFLVFRGPIIAPLNHNDLRARFGSRSIVVEALDV